MFNLPRTLTSLARVAAGWGLALAAVSASAQTVVSLQNATATFSQTNLEVIYAIDGDTTPGSGAARGWAVGGNTGNTSIAAFETVTDLGFVGGTLLSFTLTQVYSTNTALGRFRISVTTDDRNNFADGLANGGNVTANWTVLSLTSLVASNGGTFVTQGDGSVLLSDVQNASEIYTFNAYLALTGVTGLRLEAIADASLPGSGPGRAGNGNFVVTEFALTATAVPEPSTYAVFTGLAALALVVRRRRK